jgi:hypothetical protein
MTRRDDLERVRGLVEDGLRASGVPMAPPERVWPIDVPGEVRVQPCALLSWRPTWFFDANQATDLGDGWSRQIVCVHGCRVWRWGHGSVADGCGGGPFVGRGWREALAAAVVRAVVERVGAGR